MYVFTYIYICTPNVITVNIITLCFPFMSLTLNIISHLFYFNCLTYQLLIGV